jgi:hypothetical protein
VYERILIYQKEQLRKKRPRDPAKASKENDPLQLKHFFTLTIKQLRKTVQISHQLSVKPSKST